MKQTDIARGGYWTMDHGALLEPDTYYAANHGGARYACLDSDTPWSDEQFERMQALAETHNDSVDAKRTAA